MELRLVESVFSHPIIKTGKVIFSKTGKVMVPVIRPSRNGPFLCSRPSRNGPFLWTDGLNLLSMSSMSLSVGDYYYWFGDRFHVSTIIIAIMSLVPCVTLGESVLGSLATNSLSGLGVARETLTRFFVDLAVTQ